MKRIIIIGGGVSGVTTAIHAKKDDNEVIVLERNSKSLKKLLMTGNGKCNYMNEVYGVAKYHSQNIDIVDKIISSDNIKVMKDFFDSLGIVPKIKNGYYYPFSNQASTIKKALMDKALELGVKFVYDTLVEEISKENDTFFVKTQNKTYEGQVLVLATGSCAYPKTGSDGCGYRFLKNFGHAIVKPLPALVPLICEGDFFKEWAGVRTDVEIDLFEDGKHIAGEIGEIQLTDYGISGICTFQLSHYISRGLDNKKGEEVHINFVPFIETLITPWMDQYSKKHTNKNVRDLLEGFLNYKLVDVILKKSDISEDNYYQDLNNQEKLRLCKNLRSFPLKVRDTKGFAFAQICNGGVKLTEVNYCTMESNFIKNLFITGELLDMNGLCGGYNLTTCWISGILAGEAIGDFHD